MSDESEKSVPLIEKYISGKLLMGLALLIVGGQTGVAIIGKYLGVDVDDVKTEIVTHAKDHDKKIQEEIMARVDSLVNVKITEDSGPLIISEAVGEDIDTVKAALAMAKRNMATEAEYKYKDSIWENVEKPQMMEDLAEFNRLNRNGCGGAYKDEGGLWFVPCFQRDHIQVKTGTPPGMSHIIDCAWGLDAQNKVRIFKHLRKVEYVPGTRIVTNVNE